RIDEWRQCHHETASRQGAGREHVDRLDRGRRIALRLDEGVDEPIELGSAPTRTDPPQDAPEVAETHPVVEPDLTPGQCRRHPGAPTERVVGVGADGRERIEEQDQLATARGRPLGVPHAVTPGGEPPVDVPGAVATDELPYV